MDIDALNATLAALNANQQQFQANQQQIGHALAALTGLVLAPPAPAPAVPVQAFIGPEVKYSGLDGECFAEWLQHINRKALAENWPDDVKRRVAGTTLCGAALTWNDEIGVHIVGWNQWIQDLRTAFELRLTEGQWQVLVEGRRQLLGEAGTTYVMEKLKICRRSPAPLTEPQMVPYLIRGLRDTNHKAVMMVNPPITIANFVTELRRLEEISKVVGGEGKAVGLQLPGTTLAPTPADNQELQRTVNALAAQVSALNIQLANQTGSNGVRQPPRTPPPLRHVNLDPPMRRPPGAANERQCYACQGFGHMARECPNRLNQGYQPQGNANAGSTGQGRQ